MVDLSFQTDFNQFLVDFRDSLLSYAVTGTAAVFAADAWMGEKDISLFGTTDIAANMSEFSQSYHIPEPMAFLLIGTGLLGLGILGRRSE